MTLNLLIALLTNVLQLTYFITYKRTRNHLQKLSK